MSVAKEVGMKAEYYVMDKLEEQKLKAKYIDDWYDLELLDDKIEIKSCAVSVKNGENKGRTIGRFNFTSGENREQQHEQGVWYCFVLRFKNEMMIMGFSMAHNFKDKTYLSLHEIANKPLLSFESFVELIKNKHQVMNNEVMDQTK